MRQSAPSPPPTEPASPRAPETFRELYDKTLRLTSAWLFRLGIPEREWKDAIQEIYLEASRSWTTFSPSLGNREKWLYGIAVNVAKRIRKRSRSRARWEEPESHEIDVASTSPSAEDHVLLNDRARFTLQLFEPINTLPLLIMIAHDMNDESMKDIASRHQLSLSEAYRLRDQAKYIFTEGYEREQAKRRKSGVLILPFSALSLLAGPHALPELSPNFKAEMWARITQKIADGPGPDAPSHDSSPQTSTPAASIPPMPPAPAAPLAKRAVVQALRVALSAHPIAGPALFFVGGAIASLVGEHLLDTLDKNKRVPIAQEAPAALVVGAPAAPLESASPVTDDAVALPRASDSAGTKGEPGPASELTTVEAAKFDIVRAASVTPDNDSVFKAIKDYLKVYPRGHFVGNCEKIRIQTLIRAGRLQEARASIARLRQRSPKSPLLKELESALPSP